MKPLDLETLKNLRNEFYRDPKNQLAQNACTRFDPNLVAINKRRVDQALHVYNIQLETESQPVTNQEESGLCWIFAALNVMRLPFMKKYKLEAFEFSQSYLLFWNKIEQSYYWLNNIIETAKEGEKLEERVVNFLLGGPVPNGGRWDYFVNLVNKHGVMPKQFYPETFCSQSTNVLNEFMRSKLREFAKILRDKVAAKASDQDLNDTLEEQMKEIYNIVAICLGIPPKRFTFEFYDKEKKYNNFGLLTPLDFYKKHIRPVYNVDDKVTLIHDTRESNPFGHPYTVQFLGNMVGGRTTILNNQPIDVLIKAAVDSIQGGEAVWFAHDVGENFENIHGLQDLNAQDFKLVFNTESELNKADRLLYLDSDMHHAMVLTAVGTDEKGNPLKFRVENSWGKDDCTQYPLLTAQWFKEFVSEVVVDKKYLPSDVLAIQKPKVLPPWDPIGKLVGS